MAVGPRAHAVVLAAQFHAGHVLEAQHSAVRPGAHDNFAELLGRDQAALGVNLPGELRGGRRRHVAQTAGRELGVLLLNGLRHVIDRQGILGQLVRLKPDAHGVAHAAENRGVAHAGHALEFVYHVDLHPVLDIDLVIAAVRRIESKDLEHGRGALDHAHALAAHLFRQQGLGQIDLVVDVDQGHVRVGTQREIDVDGAGTRAGGGCGSHVQHVFHAVDVHFQRGQHRGGDGLSGRAGIGDAHVDRGRHQIRVLRDGQGLQSQGCPPG